MKISKKYEILLLCTTITITTKKMKPFITHKNEILCKLRKSQCKEAWKALMDLFIYCF